MSGRFSERLTYANVASTLALIIAIGGGGAAVAAVAVNSVGSPQIIDGAIKTRDLGLGSVSLSKIKPNAVGTAKVIDNSLTSADVADGTLQHSDLTSSKIGVVRGYAYISTANSGIPLSTPTVLTNGYTYNSTGGDITLNHSAVGVYSVTFAGLDIFPGHVQVTSYGTAVTWCKVGNWGGTSATVRCFNAAGAPTNSPFTVAMIE
jgi:hypothetical protein